MLTVATAGSAGAPAVSSWPPDTTNYQRPAINGDKILNRPVSSPALAIAGNSGTTTPGIFVTDPNNVDFNSRGEPSIAIRATNANTIDIHAGFGG